jgi:hypothetical protein
MKKIPFLILTFLLFPALGMGAEIASITTVDGLHMDGELLNSGDILEWRKDIYEMKGSGGKTERFFLKPGLTGRVRISEIREIRRIQTKEAPEDIVTLSNDQKARLLLKYLLIFANGKSIYISDFITMEHFFLEISALEGSRRIYLSKLESMVLKTASQEPIRQRQVQEVKLKPLPEPVQIESKSRMNQITYRTQFEFISEKPPNRGILIFFAGLSILLTCMLVLVLLLRTPKSRGKNRPFQSRIRKKNRRKPAKKARKRRKRG